MPTTPDPAASAPAAARAGSGAWTEPGAHRVAEGVHRIPLPLPGDGLRAVNVYAVEDGDRIALIDAGWHRRDSWEALAAGLGEIGAEVGDVSRVLVTHIHHDHYGQAARLREVAGAVVVLGSGEERSLEVIRARQPDAELWRAAQLRRRGAEQLLAEVRRAVEHLDPAEMEGRAIWELPDAFVADTSVLELQSRTLEVVATPGHTRGHVAFLDREASLLFAGDHVLPHITPSLGLEPFSDGHPLIDFLASLRKVRSLPVARVLPAHGPDFADLSSRVDALLAHHRARLAACLEAVGRGRRSALDVALELPWTRREKRYSELDLFNRILAVHETAAHLDLLVVEGRLSLEEDGEVALYSPPTATLPTATLGRER